MFEYICDGCGEKHITSQRKRCKHSFCCKKCEFTFKHNKVFESRKCIICESEFEARRKDEKHTLCSLKCQIEWQRQNPRSGALNPRYLDNVNHEIICEWCGTTFTRNAYQVKNGARFCSNECRREWYAKVWSQRDEWKQNRREWAISLLENNKISHTNSGAQILVNSLLNKLNIDYQSEKPYNQQCSVDNYLTDSNLVIEVMGTFFHCDIRKYQTIPYSSQVTRIRMDKIKHSLLKNYYGINILYLWENDLNNNLILCERLIQKYIESNGVLENYHSINYLMVNNNLILNDDIILPYMDWDIEKLNTRIKLETKEKICKKQQDKWVTYNCEYCGKEKEELISHYEKKKHHFCSVNCSSQSRVGIKWKKRTPHLSI